MNANRPPAPAPPGSGTVAEATIVGGANTGARLEVWPAGQIRGDLGWPRLNQRVALYAEQLFERGARTVSVKRFATPDAGEVEVRIEFRGDSAGQEGR